MRKDLVGKKRKHDRNSESGPHQIHGLCIFELNLECIRTPNSNLWSKVRNNHKRSGQGSKDCTERILHLFIMEINFERQFWPSCAHGESFGSLHSWESCPQCPSKPSPSDHSTCFEIVYDSHNERLHARLSRLTKDTQQWSPTQFI